MSQYSDFIRKAFGDSDRKRDAGLKTSASIKRFDNISYGSHPEYKYPAALEDICLAFELFVIWKLITHMP